MLNNLSNNFIPVSHFPSFPLLRELQERFLFPGVVSGFHPSRFAHSLPTIDASTCGCLLHRGTNQCTRSSQRMLEGFSIDYLNGIVYRYFANESESVDNLKFNSLIATNEQQAALPSLPPVTLVKPVKRESQEPVSTKTVKYNATEISDAGASGPITRQKVRALGAANASQVRQAVSDKGKMNQLTSKARHVKPVKGRTRRVKRQAKTTVSSQGGSSRAESQAKYLGSDKGKEVRARYLASDKGREVSAKYFKSDQFKACLAKYAASDKGKATSARYAGSQKCKKTRAKYRASSEGQAAQARYATSDKGKLSQAIRTAKYRAYQSALRNGFSKELAREKAQAVADKKRAELSLTNSL